MSSDSLILILKSLKLTTVVQIYDEALKLAEKENWGYRKFLSYLVENETQARNDRRTERLLRQSKLPEGKTLASLDEKLLPEKCRRMLPSILDGSLFQELDWYYRIIFYGVNSNVYVTVHNQQSKIHGHPSKMMQLSDVCHCPA